MLKRLAIGIGVAAIGLAAILYAQQEYPNVEVPVILENDHVIVQRVPFQPGDWVGEHSHPGNQLAILIDEVTTIYKTGDGETTETRPAGDVFWIDAVTHDHKSAAEGTAILVTIK